MLQAVLHGDQQAWRKTMRVPASCVTGALAPARSFATTVDLARQLAPIQTQVPAQAPRLPVHHMALDVQGVAPRKCPEYKAAERHACRPSSLLVALQSSAASAPYNLTLANLSLRTCSLCATSWSNGLLAHVPFLLSPSHRRRMAACLCYFCRAPHAAPCSICTVERYAILSRQHQLPRCCADVGGMLFRQPCHD